MIVRRIVFTLGLIAACATSGRAETLVAVNGATAAVTVTGGTAISVSISGGPANATDWVALYQSGAADGTYLDWRYLSGSTVAPATGLADATVTFFALAPPGDYEFRVFANNGFERLATSAPVTIIASPAQVTVNGTSPPTAVSVGAGSHVTVGVTDGPANAGDWIALYATSSPDTTYVTWRYLNGTTTAPATGLSTATLDFAVPASGGGYEFRFFAANGFVRLATSTTVVVASSSAVLDVNGVSAPGAVSVAGGSVAVVSVSAGPANATDWVGLYVQGSADGAFVDWRYLSDTALAPATGVAAATLHFAIPTVAGSYEFRFFADNGFGRIATSGAVTVSPSPAQISVNGVLPPTDVVVQPGATVTVQVTGGPANTTDWIALSASGSANGSYIAWQYLNGQTTPPAQGVSGATVTFSVPTDPATYEFRLFANNGFGRVATSGAVTVSLSPAQISVNGVLPPTDVMVQPGATVTVQMTGGPANTTDWIALAPSGSANGSYITWQYLNGLTTPPAQGVSGATLTFSVPTSPATNEFRLFANNGFSRLATSSTIVATTNPLTVLSTTPSSNQTAFDPAGNIVAVFSQPLAEATVTTANFELRDSANAIVAASVSYQSSSQAAVLDPVDTLVAGNTYTAMLKTGITSAVGMALQNVYSWSFTTSDVTPPTVISATPASGTRNVTLTPVLQITFSEALDPATVTAGSIQLLDTRSVVVPGTVTYDSQTLVATFTPTTALLPTRTYTAMVGGGTTGAPVKDLAGNALASTYSWTFISTVEPVRIAAGLTHSVAVDNSGQVWTWGSGPQQRGTQLDGRLPGSVDGASGVVSVAAGVLHTLALKTDGTVLAWGANNEGQLGIGNQYSRSTPVAVTGLSNVIAIAGGWGASMALKADGTVWTWGYAHQIGDGENTQRLTPVQVPNLTDVIAIASSKFADLALKGDGTVWIWGDNDFGQIGNGSGGLGLNQLTPIQVSTLGGVVGIAGGDYHSLAIVGSDLSIRAWGSNSAGQIGDGSVSTERYTPVGVSGLVDVRSVAGGGERSLAALLDGTIQVWGRSVSSTGSDSSAPITAPGAPNGAQVAGGASHSVAVTAAGTVWTWGQNTGGQLGIGTTTNRPVAAAISADGFMWNVAAPTFSINGGEYSQALSVSITTVTPDATIHYTTDGLDPTESSPVSSGVITIDQSATLKARAWRGQSPSSVSAATYTLRAAAPGITPTGGAYTAPPTIAMTTVTTGATIRYTIDGSTPTSTSPVYAVPFALVQSATLRARVFKGGWTPSDVTSASYEVQADSTPPTITATVSPTPSASGWNNTPVTVRFTCADAYGIAQCPDPVVVSTEGNGLIASGIAVDTAGNQSSVSVQISIDKTPATVDISAPMDGATTVSSTFEVQAIVNDELAGVTSATCNGVPAIIAGSNVMCTVSLINGPNSIVVSAMDGANNSASRGTRVIRTATRTALVITPTSRSIVVGEAHSLRALDQIGLAVNGVAWTSSDSSVASVSEAEDGSFLVTGAFPGEATITASAGDTSAATTVTVYQGPFLPVGTAKWTYAPAGGAYSTIPVHQSNSDDPEQLVLGANDDGTALVARAVNTDGEELWTEPLRSWPIFSDSFGGLVSLIFNFSSYAFDGLARVGGATGGASWEYHSSGTIQYNAWAQAPGGTIYLLEHSNVSIGWQETVSLVALDGRTGSVKSRAMLPHMRACTGEPMQSPASYTLPYVGTDGAAYVGATVGTPDDCYINQFNGLVPGPILNESKAYLLRMDEEGNSSLRVIRSYDSDMLVCPYGHGCTGTRTGVYINDVKPDGQGGMLVSGADGIYHFIDSNYETEGRPWTLRVTDDAVVEWRNESLWLSMVGRDNTVYAFDSSGTVAFSAYTATTGALKWSTALEGLGQPIKALPDGGAVFYDQSTGALTTIDSSGQRAAESDILGPLYQPFFTAVDEVSGNPYNPETGEVVNMVVKLQTTAQDDNTTVSPSAAYSQNAAKLPPDTGIFVRGHFVVAQQRHSYIRIVPSNQSFWKGPDSGFAKYFSTYKENGLYYATLGAESTDTGFPRCDGLLKSVVNRLGPDNKGDVHTPPVDSSRLTVPSNMEDSKIGLLFDRDANYDDDLPYACTPDFPFMDNAYNSNSYAHGLLDAADLPLPSFSMEAYPGWIKPVPKSKFDPHP